MCIKKKNVHIILNPKSINDTIVFLFLGGVGRVELEFELRASHFLNRRSITWATPPALPFSIKYKMEINIGVWVEWSDLNLES
jgi:hypothetical protein